MDELYERGRARYPQLAVPREAFVSADATSPEDLYLAIACTAKVPGAAEAFRAEYAAQLAMFAATILKDRAAVDELVNQLMIDLLVDGKLASYTGKGPLRAWLRMTATRRALNAKRDSNRRGELDGRMMREAVNAASDPETMYLRQLYGPAFEQAFKDAIRDLPADELALIRLSFGEGLALGALAAMYGWSKPTASRRLAAIREKLMTRTTELLRERLSLSGSELESVIRLVKSDLDLNLSGILE